MATIEVETEDVFEGHKGRLVSRIKDYLTETYSQDREDVASDLEDILEADTPKFSVEVVLRLGKQVISVSGLTAEEKDEDTQDDE
jgi:hypothetical protein